jgi:hypothetical protein
VAHLELLVTAELLATVERVGHLELLVTVERVEEAGTLVSVKQHLMPHWSHLDL